MSTISVKPRTHHIQLPTLHKVETTRPLAWLARGAADFVHALAVSLPVGVLFAALGWVLLEWAWPRGHPVLTLGSGFLLVAPFLAIVFYEGSRHRARPGTRWFSGVRENMGSIGLFGALLAFIWVSWERLSAILVALFLRRDFVVSGEFSLESLFAGSDPLFLAAYLVAGGALAALVFALSVVSLPMLLDRRVDLVTALVTSLYAVRVNPGAMLIWAAIIVVLSAASLLLWLWPLAVVFPLLGHASWHAYRDLVEE